MRTWFVVWCWSIGVFSYAQEVHIPLNDGWRFSRVGKELWYPAVVPGVVHTDLLRNGLIPDPYKGSNVDSVQWIENEAWIYERTVIATDTLLRHGHLDLVFKGLDTFAEVYLNDSLLGKADNMFRTWEWPIKALLRNGENKLKVIFLSPIKEGAKLREAYGIQLPHDNDPTGVSPYIRKAAYQFGWDFCPRLVTSGIWQGVELRGWSVGRIESIDATSYETTNGFALQVRPVIDLPPVEPYEIAIRVNGSVIKYQEVRQLRKFDPLPIIDVDIKNARQWWPIDHGEQFLYDVEVELRTLEGVLLSTKKTHMGICAVDLVEHRDSVGVSFKFKVNKEVFFAKGCNLIPPSMFPSIDDGHWVKLVGQIKDAGMNMVRVWSGGVYPPEAFFTACDSIGILVWQDLMFASLVPGTKDFLETSRIEVAQQVSRISLHPSVALWCGNNELDVAWENWGWQKSYSITGHDQKRIERSNTTFFKRRIPEVVSKFDGYGNYTPTSPLSNWGNAEGLTKGDLHYWGVWHGDSAFSSFENNVGRFVSEWGFQSYPDSTLLSHYIDPKELYLGSPAVNRLQRSYKTDKPIWEAIERELGEPRPNTLDSFIEASQRVQAKAYRMATEAHLAAQPHCMGTLLWQLNDCWPGPSWSIIDYEGNPKPAYFEVQKEFTATP